MSGQVIGTAGGSLQGAAWAKNTGTAKTGADGEARTARLLDRLATTTPATVLHDLVIQPRGQVAWNVDHCLVSGRSVYLCDSKVWKAGFPYWSLLGHTFRGLAPFPYADKRTMSLSATFLASRGVPIVGSVFAVWPSSRGETLNLRFCRNRDALVLPAKDAVAWLAERATAPADPEIVDRLLPYVVARKAPSRRRDSNPRRGWGF